MNKLKKDLKVILNNQSGVAIMMVMTAIILLMAIYGEFTFESKIARLKATNILDKSQSKLLAESGLQLAMARLRLYKEAFNAVAGNPNAAQMVQPQLLNQLWEVPFIYPIPVGDGANRAFKDTVDKFTKESLLDGEMKVTIQNISNRMNLNLLRIDMQKFNVGQGEDDMDNTQDRLSQLNLSDTAIQQDVSVDQSLYFLLKRLVEDKKEKDEAFADKYGNVNYQEMITNLKFYMSDFQSMNQDPLVGEAEANFQKVPLMPKFGPLGSSSELYSIPGWDDQLIELIQNEFSVYPSKQIDFNKLTANMLKILFPLLQEGQILEFFTWRDDPQQPKQINSKEDFKKYIVTQERWMSDTDFDERLKLFEAKGITFGSNPNLFKIVAEGTYNRSIYTLVAYVVLPKNETTPAGGQTAGAQGGQQDGDRQAAPGTNPPGQQSGQQGGQQNQNTQLLEPRIIEIQVN